MFFGFDLVQLFIIFLIILVVGAMLVRWSVERTKTGGAPIEQSEMPHVGAGELGEGDVVDV